MTSVLMSLGLECSFQRVYEILVKQNFTDMPDTQETVDNCTGVSLTFYLLTAQYQSGHFSAGQLQSSAHFSAFQRAILSCWCFKINSVVFSVLNDAGAVLSKAGSLSENVKK